jgi:hypothetical protein
VCEKLLSGIHKGKNVLDPKFLNSLLLKEDEVHSIGWCVWSGAVHTVKFVVTRLLTVPTLTALCTDKVRSTPLLRMSDLVTSVAPHGVRNSCANSNSLITDTDAGKEGTSNVRKAVCRVTVCCPCYRQG